MGKLRNSIKAIIIENNKILLTENEDHLGTFYMLPGGGQHFTETFEETIRRKCVEEIGALVKLGKLMFIREYIGKNHEFANWDYDMHQIELMFECSIENDQDICLNLTDDKYQTGAKWIDLGKINDIRIYPSFLKRKLICKDEKIYQGDVL